MQKRFVVLFLACSGVAHAAVPADPVPAPAVAAVTTAPATPAPPAGPATRDLILASQTELMLAPDAEISSKTAKLGDKVMLTTAADVLVDGLVVIPKGTHAEGSVSFVKGTGSFGKSGKLEITFETVDLGDRHIALTGSHRQEGSGNGGATAGAVVAAGLVGGFLVKGHSAVVFKGASLSAHTANAETFTVPADGTPTPPSVAAVPAVTAAPAVAPTN